MAPGWAIGPRYRGHARQALEQTERELEPLLDAGPSDVAVIDVAMGRPKQAICLWLDSIEGSLGHPVQVI
jgi:hypothetical protein